MGRCISCGRENEFNAEFCVFCGHRLGRNRECPKCGIVNSPEDSVCRICGAQLDGLDRAPSRRPTERPGYRPKVTRCKKCGSVYDSNLIGCPRCESHAFVYDKAASRSSLPIGAGIALAIAGFLNILNGLVLGMISEYLEGFEYCGALEVLFGVVALMGWVFCMQRAHPVFVMIAALITVFSVGPYFVSTVLGVIAFVLVAVSWKDFR